MKQIRKLHIPMLSTSVARLMSLPPDDPDYFEAVMATVERDAGLVTEAFRLTRSAAFEGSGGEVENLAQAMVRLGARQFVSLVLSSHLVSVFVPASREMSTLWRHALLVASGNRHLASRFPHLGLAPDWAYVVGLLHNVGAMALARTELDRYRKILAAIPIDDPRFLDMESSVFGVNHVEVGALAAEQWKLPDDLTEVIRHHHAPSLPDGIGAVGLIRVTQLALAFQDRIEKGAAGNAPDPAATARIRERSAILDLELEDEDLQGLLAATIADEAVQEFERLGVAFLKPLGDDPATPSETTPRIGAPGG